MTVPTNNEEAEALRALIVAHDPEDSHPSDQRRCICGEVIGTSDGVVVTTDPYSHLIECILAAGFRRLPVSVDTAETPTSLVEYRDHLRGLGYSTHEITVMLIGFQAGLSAPQSRKVEVSDASALREAASADKADLALRILDAVTVDSALLETDNEVVEGAVGAMVDWLNARAALSASQPREVEVSEENALLAFRLRKVAARTSEGNSDHQLLLDAAAALGGGES